MLWLQGWPPAIRLWHPQQQQLRWLTPTRHHESRVNPYWPALVQRSSTSTQCNPWSRVCAVAQYAVLEANGKVNGIGEISNPSPSQTLDQFGCRFKYITTSPKGVDVPNFVEIGQFTAEICLFLDFSKIAAVRHLGFVMCVFGPPTKGIWWSLSLCKIWLESMQ